jgi:hypothetical protein
LKPAQAKKVTRPYLEKAHYKNRAGGMAQIKVLSSNPSTEKKKKKKHRGQNRCCKDLGFEEHPICRVVLEPPN